MKKILKWFGGFLFVLIIIGGIIVNHFGPTVGAKLGMPLYVFPRQITVTEK